jgi:hypothetical protein
MAVLGFNRDCARRISELQVVAFILKKEPLIGLFLFLFPVKVLFHARL